MNIIRFRFKAFFKYVFFIWFSFLFLSMSSAAKAAETIEWFDKGNVQIGFHDKEVISGGNFRITIKNEGQYALDYEIKLKEPGVSTFAAKQSGIIEADKSLPAHISVGSAGEYTARIDLYYKGHSSSASPNYTQDYNFTVSNSIASAKEEPAVQVTEDTNAAVSSPDKKISAGDNFRITIENKSSSDLKYEIKVDDLKTGQFVKKSSGVISAKTSASGWVPITSEGNHTVEVSFFNALNNNPLSTKTLKVAVSSSGNTNKTVTEKSSTNTPSLAELQPRTNSTNGKVNPSLGYILSGIFQGTDDATKANLDSVNLIILKILEYAFNFAGIVAFVMVLWAARAFLNAYGSDEAAAMGKKTLVWAFVGLCVIIISKALLIWIYQHLAN